MPRMSFALATTVALIASVSTVAVGQSPASNLVTIEPGQVELTSPGVMTPNADKTAYLEEGREMTLEWVASDPRLSGEVTCAGNRLVNRDGSFVEAETFVIANEGGRWSGQSTGHVPAGPPADSLVGIRPVSTGLGRIPAEPPADIVVGIWPATARPGHVPAEPPADIVVGIWPVSAGPDHMDVVALRGEGDYEGLSAVISADWSADPPLITGAIFEGALPSAPELAIG